MKVLAILRRNRGGLMVILYRRRLAMISVGASCLMILLVHWASITDNVDYRLSCQVMNKSTDCVQNIRSIAFAELSGRTHLSFRAACAIESAAQHHPDWPVMLYNKSYIVNDTLFNILHQLPNFHLQDLNLDQLFNNTPLNHWYQSGAFREGPYWIEKLSDAIRLILLWNNGGIYLDTDVIVLRSMSRLCDVIGLETLYKVNGAIMSFEKHHSFLNLCLNEFERSFNPFIWGTEGPTLLTKSVLRACNLPSNSDIYSLVSGENTCAGLAVLPWHSFYPLPWPMWPKLYSVVSQFRNELSCSYTIHLWNSMSKGKMTNIGSRQLLDVVAEQNCPNVYNLLKKSKIKTF